MKNDKKIKDNSQLSTSHSQLNKGWELKKLGEVCGFVRGPFGGSLKKDCFVENGFAVYEQQHAIYDQFEDIRYFIDEEKFNEMKRFELLSGDLIMSCSGTMGKVAIVPQGIKRGIINQALLKLTPKKNINIQYLRYWMVSDVFKQSIEKHSKGAAIKNVASVAILKNIEFPVPPHPEQQRIVAYLDQTFAQLNQAKANLQKNLQNAKELFESELNSIFENGGNNEGWIEKTLGELGTITSSKRIYKSEYVNEGVPFYRTKEIKEISNGKNLTLELFISRDRYNEIKKTFGVPQINDLLMSAVGTIGEIMVIKNNDEFYFKDGNIVWFKGFKELETDYLKYALTAFVEKIRSLAIGSAYSALTIEKLNLYKLSFPKSLQTQQAIVAKLDALKAQTQQLESIYQTKLNNLEELRSGILKRAFEYNG